MKVIVSIAMTALFLFASTSSSFATDKNPPGSASKELRAMIIDWVGSPKLPKNSSKEVVELRFVINENNELVVMETNNDELDNYFKNRLNYRKIELDHLPRKPYYMKFTIKR